MELPLLLSSTSLPSALCTSSQCADSSASGAAINGLLIRSVLCCVCPCTIMPRPTPTTPLPHSQEYGCCKAADYAGKRGQVFAAFHDAADALGMAGTIVWQVVPWSGLKRDG